MVAASNYTGIEINSRLQESRRQVQGILVNGCCLERRDTSLSGQVRASLDDARPVLRFGNEKYTGNLGENKVFLILGETCLTFRKHFAVDNLVQSEFFCQQTIIEQVASSPDPAGSQR